LIDHTSVAVVVQRGIESRRVVDGETRRGRDRITDVRQVTRLDVRAVSGWRSGAPNRTHVLACRQAVRTAMIDLVCTRAAYVGVRLCTDCNASPRRLQPAARQSCLTKASPPSLMFRHVGIASDELVRRTRGDVSGFREPARHEPDNASDAAAPTRTGAHGGASGITRCRGLQLRPGRPMRCRDPPPQHGAVGVEGKPLATKARVMCSRRTTTSVGRILGCIRNDGSWPKSTKTVTTVDAGCRMGRL